MSRSYKHTPYSGERDKFSKKQANRKVRRHKMDLSLPKGGYKKVYCSWEICDYWDGFISADEYYATMVKYWYGWRHKYEPYPDYNEAKNDYMKYYIRK